MSDCLSLFNIPRWKSVMRPRAVAHSDQSCSRQNFAFSKFARVAHCGMACIILRWATVMITQCTIFLATKRWPSLKKPDDRFCLVIDLTEDYERLILVRSESFSIAAFCCFFTLIIDLASRLTCLNRWWSRGTSMFAKCISQFVCLFVFYFK